MKEIIQMYFELGTSKFVAVTILIITIGIIVSGLIADVFESIFGYNKNHKTNRQNPKNK